MKNTDLVNKFISEVNLSALTLKTLSALQTRHDVAYLTVNDIGTEILTNASLLENAAVGSWQVLLGKIASALSGRQKTGKSNLHRSPVKIKPLLKNQFNSNPSLIGWHIGSVNAPAIGKFLKVTPRVIVTNNGQTPLPEYPLDSSRIEPLNVIEKARLMMDPQPPRTFEYSSTQDLISKMSEGRVKTDTMTTLGPVPSFVEEQTQVESLDFLTAVKDKMSLLTHDQLVEVQLHALSLMDDKHKQVQIRLNAIDEHFNALKSLK